MNYAGYVQFFQDAHATMVGQNGGQQVKVPTNNHIMNGTGWELKDVRNILLYRTLIFVCYVLFVRM